MGWQGAYVHRILWICIEPCLDFIVLEIGQGGQQCASISARILLQGDGIRDESFHMRRLNEH